MILELELSGFFESDIKAELNASIATMTLTAVDVVITQSPTRSTAVTGAVGGNTSRPFFEVFHNELTRSDLTSLAGAAANRIRTRPSVGRASEATNGINSRTVKTSIASSAAYISFGRRKCNSSRGALVTNLRLTPAEEHVTNTRVAARSVRNLVVGVSARRTTLALSGPRVRVLVGLAREALLGTFLRCLGVSGADLAFGAARGRRVTNRTQRAVVVGVGHALNLNRLDSSIVVTTRQSSVLDELPLNGVHAHAHVVLKFDIFGNSGSPGHYRNAVHDETETVKSTFSIYLVEESNVARGNQSESQFQN